MNYSFWRSATNPLAVIAIYVGAGCAVFFSPSGMPPQALIEPIPAALAAVEPFVYAQHSLPVAQERAIVEEDVAIVPVRVAQTIVTDVAPVVPQKIEKAAEARLVIPSIGVNATIKEMGYTSAGAMAVPANRIDVGWFKPGTVPGAIGSAVIGGHNEWAAGAGVFARLDELAVGDRLTVIDASGAAISFIVKEMRTYDPVDDATAIFDSASGIHLNLITCSGTWNAEKKEYSTRLVVFTDKE